MFHLRRLLLILAMLVLLAGCAAAPASPAVQCRIVLESSPAFTAQTQTAAVTPGQSVNFALTPADGYTLTGADYPGASLTRTGAAYILTLPDVRYSVAVAVTAEKSDTVLYYNDNCGGGWVTVPVTASHLRLNTAIDGALFTRPGYTLTGWNTAPDGSGQAVGLGSRTEPGARLYAQWAAQNDAAEFTYTVENGAAAITGWQGGGEVLVIPDTLGGAPVVEIAAGAFADAPCKTVIFPDTLRRVQPGAFSGSAAESVTLFDNLQQISDYAFEDCTSLQTLYINAATAPVYSGSYYATFADKYDRLLSLADTQKLVLFSGSSARFGYDSAALDAALPHYEVVNMGVFAYTNALPQLELIRAQMRPGDLLAAESDKPRLILVGGSAAAFGVDSALLARELPDYQPVNFGLYAALGTRVMLDLSIKELRPGDLVVIMPEQQRQALSDTVGADTFWQAVDGDFSALACLHARDFGPLLGAFPRFAGAKFRYFLTGAPTPDGVYRRGSFNAVGDVANPLCSANILPDGYDTTMPIRFDPSMLDTDFCDALNAYTAQAESVEAAVLYHFPPMNVLAVANAEDIDTYADYLQSQLTAPLAGDPHACVMDAGWFYDTNFHLNVSGKAVFTRQLIRDLKAVLGDTSSTEIALPAMPARRIQTDTEAANNSDAAYFTWESDRLVVNAAGRGRRTLTVPGEVDGRPVTALASDTFAGCSTLEKLTIQQNITALPDGLFAKCPALQEITLTQPDPARLSVGQALFDGAPAFCRIRVPAASYTSYCLSYAWSPYAETFAH